MGVTAHRAELPFLETIHVRKRLTPRAADDEVHGNVVLYVILIKIYRRFIKIILKGNQKNVIFLIKRKKSYVFLGKGVRIENPLSSDHLIKMLLWSRFRSWV
jgi:hypothetical protein